MAGLVRALRSVWVGGIGSTVSSTSISTSSAGFGVLAMGRMFSSSAAVGSAADLGRESSSPRSAGQRASPFQRRSPGPVGDIKPDLVKQYLGQECMSQMQLNKLTLQKARSEFARFEGDTGSSEVQVAALTYRIKYMTGHLQTHRKDKHSRRGLIAMLERRKKLLKYLRRTDGDRYGELILRLGLKDRVFVESKY